MSEWDDIKRKAQAKKAEGFELVHNLSCDSILALIAQNERLREEHDKAWRHAECNLENFGKALAELSDVRNIMAFRISLIGRLETERDELRAEVERLKNLLDRTAISQ